MADIQYLNYGDQQIEQQAFLDKAKKEVYNYVRKQPWSTKRKEKFMSAYSDIMTRGVLGASIDDKTGLYKIQVGGDVMNISPDDQKIYGDAAAYFQEQMASLPTKASLEEEAKKKAEEERAKLPIFDNEYFTTNFINHLSKNEFGGNKQFDTQNDWNGLDKRDEKTGLRGREERARILARNLQSYADSLDETKLNFEGSPFENLQDFKDRINKAVYALTETPNNIDDDNESLRKLGIRASDWFNNGSGDPVTLNDGTTTTYGQLAEYNKNKQKQEEADRIAKQKAIRANQYDGYKSFNFLNGTPGSQDDFNLISQKLAGQQSLDGNDLSKISWAFRQGMKNGGLSNLSKEELARFNFRYTNTPNRLKKIPGLEGIYYDSIGNRLVQPYKREQQTGVSLSGILEQNSPEALAKKEQDNKLKAANRKLSEGLETEDYARMLAMGQDIAGSLAAWAPGYGTAASGLLGLTSLGTNMVADIADESLTKWDVAKNAGINLGLAAVGMVPGLGLASKTGKWITNIAKWAPRLLTLQAIKDLPDSYNSLQKAINKPNELTNADWRNIAYGLSVVAGLSRGASGFAKNRIYKPAFTENTEKQYTITTSKGKKTITQKQVDEIKKLNPKNKENYNQELKKTLGLAEDETVNMKDISVLGKTIKEKGIDIKEENVPIGLSAKAKAYREYLENRNNAMKNGEGIYKYAPRFLPTNYDIYKGAATAQIPSFGLSDKLKSFWNPLSDKNLQKKGIKVEETKPTGTSSETPKTTKAKPLTSKEIKELKENIKEFNKYTEGTAKHSGNHLSEEPFKAGDFDFEVNKFPNSSAGNIDISFNGKVMKSISFDNQKDMMKKVANFLKENRKLKDDSGAFIKKFNAEKMGEILKQLKAKGVFKQGGTIDKQKIQKYKNFINK